MDTDAWRDWAAQLATGLAWADADLRLAWLNPALAELLGVGTRGLVGAPLATVLREPDATALAQRVLDERQTVQLRSVTLVPGDSGEALADITLQPFAEGVLLEVHALAPAATDGSPLAGTLRGFAHEMNNPLAGMRGAAQLLQRRVTDSELRALAGLIIAEVDRLASLADRLLHHAGAARPTAVNIHQLLERVTGLLRALPSAPELRFDYDPSVPEVWADADRLQQVLLNVMRNALEAGAATLTVRTRVEHGVRIGERALRSALRVDVGDDGPGVPPALRDTLFQPLVSGRADGAGLGLALSRELAREHGGDLRCTSRPGATVFSLYLPLDGAHA